jgi:alkylhydroperoxidase/carboxymuconolactone decarboxylase family protein YurZ
MPKPPARVDAFGEKYATVRDAFARLAEQCHEAGPLDERTRRLVKLALAVGAGLEGGVHSAVRHAREGGVTAEELEHVAVLGITTLGWPASFRALTWIRDGAK